jgi:hypothetical protein
MSDLFDKKLRQLAYVRSGSGSTSGHKIIIVKRQTDDNCEAVKLICKTVYSKVIQSSRGTFLCS